MSLADVTDPSAVHKALNEFDALGRDDFLAKYGFRRATSYYVQHNGRLYDSKAIVGAAHGFQTGTPLVASEFSGGDATVAPALSRLGFLVVRAQGWRIPVGAITVRSKIHGEYGGSTQGGIEPSAKTPNVIIYTDPEVGALHGYNFDGWADATESAFDYTGEGQVGDQSIDSRGNSAILNHASARSTIRLFKTLDQGKVSGGKRQEYIGAFRLDSAAPYRRETAKDRSDQPRKVLVFRLLREDVLPQETPTKGSGDAESAAPGPRSAPGERDTNETMGPARGPAVNTRVEFVAPEANATLATRSRLELAKQPGARSQHW